MSSRRIVSRVSALLLGLSLAGPIAVTPVAALAQPSKVDEAKDHFLKGVDLYKEGDFPAALVEFKRSYEQNPNFNVLSNIGQVYFQMKDYPNALRTLQQYLNEGGSRIKDSKRADTQKDIDTLKGRVATVTITVSLPGAEVFVDETSIGTSPLKEGVMVSSGKRKFVANKEGFNPARAEKDFAGGDRGEVTLTLTPLAPGQAQPPIGINVNPNPNPNPNPTPNPNPNPNPPKSSGPSFVGPIIGWSVTGAFAVTWGVMGGLALSADADLTTLKQKATTADALQSQADKAKTFAIVSDVMMGATIVGAGVSTALTIVVATKAKKKQTGETASPTLSVGVGPTNLSLSGSF